MNLDSSGTDNTLVIPGINIDSVEKIDSPEKILWYVYLSLLVETHHVGGKGARDHGTSRHARGIV